MATKDKDMLPWNNISISDTVRAVFSSNTYYPSSTNYPSSAVGNDYYSSVYRSAIDTSPNSANFIEKAAIISMEGETSTHGHKIVGQLVIEFDKVIVKFICSECNGILSQKVIFKLPKKFKKGKCLSRMVKQIK